MASTLGFEIFAQDKASANVAKVSGALKRAAIDVEGANIKVAKATLAVADAEKKYGAESLKAREATNRLAKAQLDAGTATKRLADLQQTAGTQVEASSSGLARFGGFAKEMFADITPAALGFAGAVTAVYQAVQQGLTQGLIRANAQVALGTQGFEQLSATAKASAYSLGLTQGEFLNAAGQAAMLAKNMGFSQATAVNFGEQLPVLANRLSVMSSGQRDAAESADVLRSALAGEFDPLQAIGINISASIVAQKAANIQQREGGRLSAQQASALAVLAIVQEQTNNQTGVLATKQAQAAQKVNETTARLKDQVQQLEAYAAPKVVAGLDRYLSFVELFNAALLHPGNIKELTQAFQDQNAKIPVTGTALGVYKGVVDSLNASVAKATWTQADYQKALDASNNAILIARGGENAYWASIDAVRTALQQNGRTLDVHTEKGRANRDALDQEAKAAMDYLSSIQAQGAPAARFNASLDQTRARLIQAAQHFGMTRNQAVDYTNKILGIPHLVATKVTTPGLDGARRAVQGLRGDIASINGKTVSVQVNADGSLTRRVFDSGGHLIGSGGKRTKDSGSGLYTGVTGGPVFGPSGVDNVPALLTAGEHVWTAHEVAAAGGHAAVKAIRQSVIGRYAAGGPVTVRGAARIPSGYGALANTALDAVMTDLALPSGGSGGSGVTRWAGVILRALSMLGQPAAWLGTVEARMNRESGGNPTIVNRWDSNWRAGTPSVGLMQVIGPTFRAYAGSMRNVGPFEYGVSVNPLANVYAGLNYALHRYGALAALSRAGGYDDGGLAVGAGLLIKRTVAPERVLSPRQTRAFEKGLPGGDVHLHVHGPIGSPGELENWLRTALTNLRRKGRW